MDYRNLPDYRYAVRSIKGMSGNRKDCEQQILDLHEKDMKKIL